MKRVIILSILGILLSLLFGVPYFYPGSSLNTWHDNIDITCGRYRYQRYLLGLKIIDRIEETEISTIYREIIGIPPSPIWQRVNTISPGCTSPQYIYHRSLWALKNIAKSFKTASYTDEAKKCVILNFFKLLQKDKNDWRAKQYAIEIFKLSIDLQNITIQHLPKLPNTD